MSLSLAEQARPRKQVPCGDAPANELTGFLTGTPLRITMPNADNERTCSCVAP